MKENDSVYPYPIHTRALPQIASTALVEAAFDMFVADERYSTGEEFDAFYDAVAFHLVAPVERFLARQDEAYQEMEEALGL